MWADLDVQRMKLWGLVKAYSIIVHMITVGCMNVLSVVDDATVEDAHFNGLQQCLGQE